MFDIAHSSERTIRGNVDKITENVKLGTKIFVCVAEQPQSFRN
jgi:hypothetical protein